MRSEADFRHVPSKQQPYFFAECECDDPLAKILQENEVAAFATLNNRSDGDLPPLFNPWVWDDSLAAALTLALGTAAVLLHLSWVFHLVWATPLPLTSSLLTFAVCLGSAWHWHFVYAPSSHPLRRDSQEQIAAQTLSRKHSIAFWVWAVAVPVEVAGLMFDETCNRLLGIC